MRLLLALLLVGCGPAAAVEPFQTHDGYGIHLMAVDVPAGRYHFEWKAEGECDFDVRFGHGVGAVPVWDALPVAARVPATPSGSGEFVLTAPTTLLEIEGAGCHWSFGYR